MLPAETAGRAGKGEDGRASTREVKVAAVSAQTGLDPATGQPVQDPASTTYLATFDPAAPFGEQVAVEARRRGIDQIRQPVVIGDGAKWIWNIAADLFPTATCVVDVFHAREHIADLARSLEPHLGVPRAEWRRARRDELDRGDIRALVAAIAAADPDDGSPASHDAKRETGYFTTNAERMRYPAFRAMGMFIGSGAVESACNTIVAQRAKQSGMHWTINGLDPLLALRVLDRSGRAHLIWETPRTQTPALHAA
jgi:hypothetical protein